MKKILLFLFISVLSLSVFGQADPDAYVKVGDAVPSFNFEIEKGKTVNIVDYKGKVVLINLFATWCPPCNVELPVAQKEIWEQFKENKKFSFLVFGREEGWDKLLPYKAKKGFTFPILPDVDRSIFSKFAKQSIPRNILIDEKGKIIYQSMGYDEKEFKKMVQIIKDKLLTLSTK